MFELFFLFSLVSVSFADYELGTYECKLFSHATVLPTTSLRLRSLNSSRSVAVCGPEHEISTLCLDLGKASFDGECIKTGEPPVLHWSSNGGIGFRKSPCDSSETEVGVTLIGRANDKNLCATTAYVAQIDFIAAVRDEATPLLVEAGFKVADISALLDCYALTTSLSEDDPARESARTSQRCAAFDLEEVRNALFNIKSYKDGGSIKATLYGVQCFRAQSPCKCVTKRGGVTSAQMVTTPMSTSTSSSSCSLTYNVLALALTLGAALK
jgi:hypothetical protein